MDTKYLNELLEIATQLNHLHDLYALEVDSATEALKKGELSEEELEYKSVEMMNYFHLKLNELTNKIVMERKNDN